MEFFAAKKIYAQNFLKEAVDAESLNKGYARDVAKHRRIGFVATKNKNMQLPDMMVRKAIKWSEELIPWMLSKPKVNHCQARQVDDQRKSIVQHVMQKSTDFQGRIIA